MIIFKGLALNCVQNPGIELDQIVRYINWELEILEHVPLSVFEEKETA